MKYEKPNMSIIKFEVEEIIVASAVEVTTTEEPEMIPGYQG